MVNCRNGDLITYFGLDQVWAEVGLAVVDDVVQGEHLVVIATVGGEVYLNKKLAAFLVNQSVIIVCLSDLLNLH